MITQLTDYIKEGTLFKTHFIDLTINQLIMKTIVRLLKSRNNHCSSNYNELTD